jgi:putative transposase
MYDADVSATLTSKVTDRVLEQTIACQSRPLGAIYPTVYLDCIVIKIRDHLRVVNKSIYLALGVNMDGHKDLLGLWMSSQKALSNTDLSVFSFRSEESDRDYQI